MWNYKVLNIMSIFPRFKEKCILWKGFFLITEYIVFITKTKTSYNFFPLKIHSKLLFLDLTEIKRTKSHIISTANM